VKGVIEVVGYGGALKQYKITLDPQRLAAQSVSVDRRAQRPRQRDNRVGGGGYVEAAGEQIVLRGDARFRGLEDIEATVIRTDDRGVPIRVGQLGEVDTGSGLRQGAMSRDGRGEIVGASIYMLKGENSRDVVARVKHKLDEIRPFLPEGVKIEPYYDRAEFIDRVLKTITKNLSEGAIIVVVCLLLTLGSIRAGLLVAGAIPFAMLVGFMGLLALGYSGNVMSLGAIDFGIVVEGAVLAIEHAMTHGGNIADRARRQRAITHAIGEVAKPAVFSVVITILTFLPLVTLEDVEGKMFRPVVVSLCFMLAGALIYALVLVPAVAPRFLTGKAGAGEPWLIRKARAGYVPALAFALRKPAVAIGSVFAGAAVLFAIGSSIGAEFLPRIFEGAFAIDTLRPPSVSLSQAIALSKQSELALKEAPEVATVVSRIGRPESAVDPQGPEASDTFVILKPKEEWRKGMTPELLMEDLAKRVDAATPATLSAFSQPIEMRVNDLVAGVKSDIAIKVFGEDMPQMISIAEKIRREVEQVPGAADVKVEVAMGLPSMQVRVNREKVGRLGVAPGDVLDVLAMARAGLPVGQVREGERVFDLVLRLGGDKVMDDGDLRRLPIATGAGNLVPLELAADVTREDTAVQVSREQMRRRLTVLANVRGRDLVGFVKEAQARTASIEVPKSMEVVWGGQFQNFNRAKDRLAMLIPVALGVIALMLVFQFQNTKYMAVTVLNLPLSVAGGLIALVMRGLPFSIPAGVGFIALCGVSVMTGIVMTTALLELQRVEDRRASSRRPNPRNTRPSTSV
jgi:cobalt-zinc-cadmium resistance protein CzcA